MDETCKNTKEQERGPGGRWRPGQSGNPRGRRAGETCRALQLAREGAVTVAIPALIEAAKAKDLDACRVLVAYGLPRQRPIDLPEPMELPGTEDLTAFLRGVLDLIAAGKVSVSRGSEIATIVATIARVDEVTQLREQVAHLTALLDARS